MLYAYAHRPMPQPHPQHPPKGKRNINEMETLGKRSFTDESMETLGKRSLTDEAMETMGAGKKTPSQPMHAEPQNVHDLAEQRQEVVDKLDARLAKMSDPQWLSEQKGKVQKRRDAAEHEVEILKAAEKGQG